MITAEDLARELGVTGKALRRWLRQTYLDHVKHDRWVWATRAEADEVKRHYLAR